MNTQLQTVTTHEDEVTRLKQGPAHDMDMLIKTQSSVLSQIRGKLTHAEADKNLNIKAIQEAVDARLSANDQRIAELSQTIQALTQENGELQAERRAAALKLEAQFQNQETAYLTMIEATQKALDILKGE